MNPGFWSSVVWLVIAYVCSVALTVAIETVGKPAGLTLELKGSQEGPAERPGQRHKQVDQDRHWILHLGTGPH